MQHLSAEVRGHMENTRKRSQGSALNSHGQGGRWGWGRKQGQNLFTRFISFYWEILHGTCMTYIHLTHFSVFY